MPSLDAGGEVMMPVSDPVGETMAAAPLAAADPAGGKRKSPSGVAALRLSSGILS